MNELFLPIEGFPGYEVGELGRITSNRNGKVVDIAQSLHKGYLRVCLWKGGKAHWRKVHRLVAIAHITNPENLPTVNHLDGNKLNCAKSNLGWATQAENNQHAYDTGLKVGLKGAKNPASKLTLEQVGEIRSLKGIKTNAELGRLYKVSKVQIGYIQKEQNWTQ